MTRRILFDNASRHAICRVWTNDSLSIEDAVASVGGCIVNDPNDPLFDSEEGNVIMLSGRRYHYEDLEIK